MLVEVLVDFKGFVELVFVMHPKVEDSLPLFFFRLARVLDSFLGKNASQVHGD